MRYLPLCGRYCLQGIHGSGGEGTLYVEKTASTAVATGEKRGIGTLRSRKKGKRCKREKCRRRHVGGNQSSCVASFLSLGGYYDQ